MDITGFAVFKNAHGPQQRNGELRTTPNPQNPLPCSASLADGWAERPHRPETPVAYFTGTLPSPWSLTNRTSAKRCPQEKDLLLNTISISLEGRNGLLPSSSRNSSRCPQKICLRQWPKTPWNRDLSSGAETLRRGGAGWSQGGEG